MHPDLASVNVHRVIDADSAAAMMRWLGGRRPILAIDTETTGLQWWTDNFTRTVQFGDGAEGWTVSVRDWRGAIKQALTYDGPVVYHNRAFDQHALEQAGFPLPSGTAHDTYTMHHLLVPLRSHKLKAIGEAIWPGSSIGQGMLTEGFRKNGWDWATVPEDFEPYWVYAALDTVLTAKLAERLWPQVQPYRAAYEREMAVQDIMYAAETRGLRLDVPYTERLWQAYHVEMDVLLEELAEYGLKNPSSARQLAKALEEDPESDWEPDEWTPTGEPVTADHVLRALPGQIAPKALRYRRLRKWQGAYLGRFLNERDANGRVHPSINTLRARTGRMSITKPALQTLPARKAGQEIRDCILAYDDDSRILAVDYDGQELRVFASYAQSEEHRVVFEQGWDPHTAAAASVYGVEQESVSPEMRNIAKRVQYGLIYGAGAAKIAETAGVSEAEASAFLSVYDQKFPAVRAAMKNIEEVGRSRADKDNPPWVTSWGGRRLQSEPDKAYKLVNYLVQGGTADLLKDKLVALDSAGYGEMIMLPVHDEVLFNVPAEDFDEHRAAIAGIMHEPDAFLIPLTVHPSGPLTRWGDVER